MLAAGQSAAFKLVEERELGEEVVLTNRSDDSTRFVLWLKGSSDKLKGQPAEALKTKGEWDAARRELQQVVADLARLTADRDRIRKTPRETKNKGGCTPST